MPAPDDMTSITQEAGNRYTAHHHQRESPALGSARQNRYTDPLHTASAERRHACRDQVAARRRPDRGRVHAARAFIGNCHVLGLRAPDGGGRAGGAGEGRLAHREGGVVVSRRLDHAGQPVPLAAAGRCRAGRHPGRAPGHPGDRVDRHCVRRGPVRPGPRTRCGQARAVRAMAAGAGTGRGHRDPVRRRDSRLPARPRCPRRRHDQHRRDRLR